MRIFPTSLCFIWLALTATVGPAFSAMPTLEYAVMDDAVDWPATTNATRPWTRWWWLGSAVDKETLTRLLEAYDAAGLGGVEITSIYGVRGAEQRELAFLSEAWVDAVLHVIRESQRLDMQVDLPTGSGWRSGGPSVTEEDANAEVVIEHEPLESGATFQWTFDQMPPQALVAYSDQGEVVDLGERLRAQAARGDLAHLEWRVPAGNWTLYTLTQRWSRDNVKRPAPGGEGKNINPLSRRSVMNFLQHFAEKINGLPAEGIRAQFHDSYEYEGNWCDDFLAQFEQRRGYKLQHHLPALDGRGDPDEMARVKCDYRETVSDLVIENLIEPWTAWSHEHGMLSRNQGHGSPANWLDVYAACDIPETESFGRLVGGDTNKLVFKFASSPAHVTGKPLVSSESATWLNEHFTTTLGEVKEIVDRLFLGGINHIFYHGTCYSPADAPWPGWLFYASTQLNPQNSIWRDFGALNQYATRCQSILQSTRPDNDVLLYWPIHDVWHDPRGLRKNLQVHNARQWMEQAFGRVAVWLDEQGYAFDYVSDRQLATCRVVDGRIQSPGASYQTVLVPGAKLMPTETLRSLLDLAKGGATIVFLDSLPSGPPGWRAQEQQEVWNGLLDWRQANASQPPAESIASESAATVSQVGEGRVVISEDWLAALKAAEVRREWFGPRERALRYHRRAWSGGHLYFLKNETDAPVDQWITPAVDFAAAAILDPLDGHVGLAAVRDADAPNAKRFRLQLAPGQAAFVKTYRKSVDAAAWQYLEPAGEPTPLAGEWSVEFVAGGPELPSPFTTHRLASWTELAGPEGERFAGTARYSIAFTPDTSAERYLLDLGGVADSARVELNGKSVATPFTAPVQVVIDGVHADDNRLVIEVTNVAANRIRDLDRRGVSWRIFKDINFVNINYRPFDATNWPVREAGLLGPVTLTPLAE